MTHHDIRGGATEVPWAHRGIVVLPDTPSHTHDTRDARTICSCGTLQGLRGGNRWYLSDIGRENARGKNLNHRSEVNVPVAPNVVLQQYSTR